MLHKGHERFSKPRGHTNAVARLVLYNYNPPGVCLYEGVGSRRTRACSPSEVPLIGRRLVTFQRGPGCVCSVNGSDGDASLATFEDDVATETKQGAAARPPAPKRGPKQRMRLDEYCMTLAPQFSRNVIQSLILQGKVRVGDKVVTKAGTPVVVGGPAAVVIDAEEPKYVCRAGFKLEKALSHWGIDVRGLTALDSGQSTGGFTDCLLQHGAAKVYGIDVGHNQLSERIRRDERVVVMEKFNLRHLAPHHLPCQVDIATLDLSFISVLLVVGPVTRVLRPDGGRLVVLIKPQFEAGRKQVGAGGLVKDPKVHAEVIQRVTAGIVAHGYELVGVTESPIKGDKSGNTEFLAYFIRRPERAVTAEAEAAEAEAAAAAEAEAGTGAV